MIYKTLKKVSDVCQLFIPDDTHTVAGVTITNNGDGSLTIDGTGTGSGNYTNFTTLGKNNMPYKISDKLFISAYIISGTCSFLFAGFSQSGNPSITLENPAEGTYYSGNISKQDKYESVDALGFFVGNNTFNNFRVKFNIINLTEMYGAGNEPTTVEEFRTKFPNELYDYKPYCFVKSYKTLLKATDDTIITSYKKSLICTTKNLFNINTTPTFNDTKATYVVEGTKVTFKSNNTANNSFFYSIPTTVGKTYTVSVNSIDWDSTSFGIFLSSAKVEDKLNYGNINKTILTKTFVAVSDTLWIHGYLSYTTGDFTFTFDKLQVELGDTATDYVPYGHL